ncbi:hypothetical protein PCANC_03083 [Puccinia coronata f. sp. avenae]|nr:hypothetical protein PCANC_07333 [Puccinia coronata f. sp. avenae]PLW57205.1 hypothetical protein PCANC_03083 [Puccinia coronata f. sp. avenae]
MRRGMGFSSCSLQQEWARAGSAPPELLGAGRPKRAGPHSGHSQLDSKFPAEYLRQRIKFPSGTTSGLIDLANLTDHFKELLTESPDMFSGKSTSAFSSSNSSGPSGGSKNHERLRIHDPYNSSHSLRVRLHRKLVMRIMQP